MSEDRQRSDMWGGSTRWTIVHDAAGNTRSGGADAAWAYLIERYSKPVLQAVRRMLGGAPSAADVAEDFFSYVYEQKVLARADRDKGRFRCFMQGVVRNYVFHTLRERDGRGRVRHTDEEIVVEVNEESSPTEEHEEAEWARAVLDNATRSLVEKSPRDGLLLLRFYGIAPYPATELDVLCTESGLNRNAVHQALFRARAKLRELVTGEVMQTVATAHDMADELEMVESRLLGAHPGLFDTSEDV